MIGYRPGYKAWRGGKDQLGEQLQSLKTLLEESLAKKMGTSAERGQLELEI